jgi:hypothetical protein
MPENTIPCIAIIGTGQTAELRPRAAAKRAALFTGR